MVNIWSCLLCIADISVVIISGVSKGGGYILHYGCVADSEYMAMFQF